MSYDVLYQLEQSKPLRSLIQIEQVEDVKGS